MRGRETETMREEVGEKEEEEEEEEDEEEEELGEERYHKNLNPKF